MRRRKLNLVSDIGDGEIGVLEKYLGFFKPDLLENLGKSGHFMLGIVLRVKKDVIQCACL